MPKTSTVVLAAVGILFFALVAGVVVSSLVRPTVEGFVPTSPSPEEVGAAAVGTTVYTVDATAHDRWVYFDFSRGSVVSVTTRSSLDWDIAFQRHRMITNGGATNRLGQAGVANLGPLRLDSMPSTPVPEFVSDEQPGDAPRNRLLESWYDYSWTSHLLRPADHVYAIRTADGRYAVLRFLGYYCPGARPGCVTFRYRYRGDGLWGFQAAPGPPNH